MAMSGGVDSSVAAALLQKQGYEVLGLTMWLWHRHGEKSSTGNPCGRPSDVRDARTVAAKLGFPHKMINMQGEFRKEIIEPFVESYIGGETPNPCIVCNSEIKFRRLLSRARALGAEVLATGHYCRLETGGDGRIRMLKAKDTSKDQSYFLFNLSQDQLRRALFPLGNLKKEQIRSIASELGLPIAEKEESQEICFVGDGGYPELISRLRPEADLSGEIVSTDGKVLGRHSGFHKYTVGQRRGIGVPADRPLYVVAIDPELRRITVGYKEALERTGLTVSNVNWLSIPPPEDTIKAEVKIRYRAEAAQATLEPLAGNRVRVRFREPRLGIAPGQAAVFYRKDLLLGGGWIKPPGT